jgi:hypothetical protein
MGGGVSNAGKGPPFLTWAGIRTTVTAYINNKSGSGTNAIKACVKP